MGAGDCCGGIIMYHVVVYDQIDGGFLDKHAYKQRGRAEKNYDELYAHHAKTQFENGLIDVEMLEYANDGTYVGVVKTSQTPTIPNGE